VIALGRSVLEGMAAGRAVYVYGVVGGDGWVTPDRYPAMEADGFAGLSNRELTIDASRLTSDLARWQPSMGEVNRDLVFSHHETREHAIELLSLAQRIGSPQSFERTPADELSHLVRRERQAYLRCTGALLEAGRLRSESEQLGSHLAAAHAHNAMLEGSLRELRETRRYRLGCLLARPLDRLPARRHVERN
jgi:hypothetical protein